MKSSQQDIKMTPAVEAIIDDPINRSLIDTLDNFVSVLAKYGISAKSYSQASLLQLSSVPVEKKIAIQKFYELWISWFKPELNEEKTLEISFETEKRILKKALDFYGVWVHEDFWNTIEKGQIIEIYSPDMTQLYRNLEFFKLCSYSILDMSIFEWYNLWQRPQRVMEEMLKVAQLIMNESINCGSYNIPKFVLREVMAVSENSPELRRASLVEFKCYGSVFKGIDQGSFGGIVTSIGENIAYGEDAEKIEFV